MSRQRSFVQTKGPDPQVVHFLNTLDGGESFHDFGVSHASGYTWEGVKFKECDIWDHGNEIIYPYLHKIIYKVNIAHFDFVLIFLR